ncbi:hypothetical protein [Pacificibacter marinus]|uniref:hypothetical protein n=1 Tax=Pacificibacter marinus TaxID=658057 RepID=UPI001C073E15|nr:hypothetical protein [Pacificibacter marinus]MBU2868941.1 hypothetical protein [Pacificibacter marinus]
MSDPMTNMGADDVLASIRRLVSETYDPQLRAKSQAKPPERFVLSPDLRVIEGSSAPYTASIDDHDAEPAETLAAPDDLAPLVLEVEDATHIPTLTPQVAAEATSEDDRAVADEALAQAAPNLDAELEMQPAFEAQPEPARATSIVEDAVHAAQVLMQDDDLEEEDTEWSSAYDDTPNAQAADRAAGLSLEERIAELESAVEAKSNDWDASGYDDDDEDTPQVFPQALVNSTARVLNFRTADFDKLAEAAEIKAQVERQADADTATVTAGDVDAAVAKTPDVAQDASDAGVHAGHEAEDPEVATSEPEAAPKSVASVPPLQAVLDALDDDEDEDLALAGYADDDVLDEEALRDMIATVIREELQGALGERITSNVRRLVRREVKRAMALREFE